MPPTPHRPIELLIDGNIVQDLASLEVTTDGPIFGPIWKTITFTTYSRVDVIELFGRHEHMLEIRSCRLPIHIRAVVISITYGGGLASPTLYTYEFTGHEVNPDPPLKQLYHELKEANNS